jgi:hypothetical protein
MCIVSVSNVPCNSQTKLLEWAVLKKIKSRDSQPARMVINGWLKLGWSSCSSSQPKPATSWSFLSPTVSEGRQLMHGWAADQASQNQPNQCL